MAVEDYEILLRHVYRDAPIGLCFFDSALHYQHINEWLASLNGLSVEEHLGRPISEVIPEVAKEVESILRHVMETGEPVLDGIFETDSKTSPQKKRIFQHSYQAVTSDDGVALGVSCIVQDITKRKRAENSLKEMNVALANAMPGIARLDLDGRYVEVNDIYADITGYRPDEMIGMNWTRTVHPDDHADAFRAYERMLHEDKVEIEALGVRKDATTFFKHVLLVKTTDEQGTATGHHCFMRDISERKLAENAMIAQAETERLLRRELDHRVRNNLASLISLIDLSRSGADSVEVFAESIKGRTQTIASVHAALSSNKWQAIDLHTLLHTLMVSELEGRFRLEGPEVIIPTEQTQALGLVIHELTVNSRKHGALCRPGGSVAVTWELNLQESGDRQMLIQWQESGGPPIETEPEPGTGMGLIRGLVKSELRGQIDIRFPRKGADHTITMNLIEDSTSQFNEMADSGQVEVIPLKKTRVT